MSACTEATKFWCPHPHHVSVKNNIYPQRRVAVRKPDFRSLWGLQFALPVPCMCQQSAVRREKGIKRGKHIAKLLWLAVALYSHLLLEDFRRRKWIYLLASSRCFLSVFVIFSQVGFGICQIVWRQVLLSVRYVKDYFPLFAFFNLAPDNFTWYTLVVCFRQDNGLSSLSPGKLAALGTSVTVSLRLFLLSLNLSCTHWAALGFIVLCSKTRWV